MGVLKWECRSGNVPASSPPDTLNARTLASTASSNRYNFCYLCFSHIGVIDLLWRFSKSTWCINSSETSRLSPNSLNNNPDNFFPNDPRISPTRRVSRRMKLALARISSDDRSLKGQNTPHSPSLPKNIDFILTRTLPDSSHSSSVTLDIDVTNYIRLSPNLTDWIRNKQELLSNAHFTSTCY
jgi:hypothetical protein